MRHWEWWWALCVLVGILGLEGYFFIGAIAAVIRERRS